MGITVTTGRRRTTSSVAPAAPAAATSTRAQPVACGEQQLRRAHVLADRPHVLERRGGGLQLDPSLDLVHVLAHDDGVEVAGNRVARVDDLERPVSSRTGLVSPAPTVSPEWTAMPSMAAASNGGDDRVAHTGSAVTRPTAWSSGSRTTSSRSGQPAAAQASSHEASASAAGWSWMNGAARATSGTA